MALYLGEHSSLALWRALGDSVPRPASSRSRIPAGPPHRIRELGEDELHYLRLAGYPASRLDVLVASAGDRRHAEGLHCRIWAAAVPQRSFAKLSDNVFLSSPEFTFLQMAAHLSLVQLIELGFELCGRYATHRGPAHARAARRVAPEPSTTPDKLVAYLSKCENVKGLKKARRAARYVMGGSESPMETKLALILCLPPALGGFGLPRATLNRELVLELADADGSMPVRRVVRCDLYWPGPREVAIEYESDEWHLGSRKFSEDSMRRNDIVSTQVQVLTVTKNQVLNLAYWPTLAGRVASVMGRKLETKAKGHLAARGRLYAELFGALYDRYERDGYVA